MRVENENSRRRFGALFIVAVLLGALLSSSWTQLPARAASETFSESFQGSSLSVPLRWTSSRGATGPGPGGVTEPSEYACLTALAPGQSITVQGVLGLDAAARPGSGLIVGCPNGGSTAPIDSPGSGALRLTREAHTQSTVVIYNEPQRMSDGLDITFSFAIHSGRTSGSATGADGLSFFIKDGANSVDSPGASGGALGYALSATGPAGSDTLVTPGLPGALLGVGFDFWGNFSYLYNATARISRSCGAGGFGFGENTQLQDRVVLRGPDTSTLLPKDGSCGYGYLGRSADPVDFGRTKAGVLSPGDIAGVPASSRTAGARRARIVIDKPGSGARVKVWVWAVGEAQPVTPVLNLPQPSALQGVETFKFGFGASTGWATNVHEIWDLGIVLADPEVQAIQAAAAAAASTPSGPSLACVPDPVSPGQDVTCTIVTGPAGVDILWRATTGDRLIDSIGVTMDDAGVGEFTFRAPLDASGAVLDVELVDWGVSAQVAVVGGPVPTRVDAGSGLPRSTPIGLGLFLAGLAALNGVRPQRRARAS